MSNISSSQNPQRHPPTEQPFNWREYLPVHPAAELFPLMSEPELRELAEDIRVNGLRVPLVGWALGQRDSLLDGRNRLDALALLGLLYETDDHHVGVKRWDGKRWTNRPDGRIGGHAPSCEFHTLWDGDPYEIALSLNVHRRHLNAERKRDLIAKVLKAKPAVSNVLVAKQTMADDKTVAKVRQELEATSEIPRLEKTIGADGKARPVKVKKKAPSTTVPPAPIKAVIDAEPVAKPSFSLPVDPEDDLQGDTPEQQWQYSLGNMAGESISLWAFWNKTFGKEWKQFDVSSESVTLAQQAADAWARIADELTTRAGAIPLTGNGEPPVAGPDYSIPTDLSIPHCPRREGTAS